MLPGEFEWMEITSPRYSTNRTITVPKLVHFSGYYYIFDNYGRQFVSQGSPDVETVKSEDYVEHESWDQQAENFSDWLTYLRREVESPDLWSSVTQESEILNASNLGDLNTSFTREEKNYIREGIDEIKQYLLTAHKLDPKLVESRLNYLAEASDRVGRKDWINLLLSVLVGIVVAAALPPETTREVFRFVGQVLHNVLQQPLLLM